MEDVSEKIRMAGNAIGCVFRGLSDTDSNFCRTGFRFVSDTVPIHIGQCSGLMSDSFRASLEGCPTRSEGCPVWPGRVSDRARNPESGGVERRWKACQGSRSIQVSRERHLMAQTKLTMRQIQEILRLKHQNQLSIREIARSCGLPTSTVGDYLKRAEAAGIGWPLPEGQGEKELLQLLIAHPVTGTAACPSLPDWPYIHEELRRKAVTLQLLWQEYRQAQPESYGYSRFCELYRRWAGTLDPVLRQVHLPGEKMFVDWAGQTVPIYSALDGSVSAGHLFVAVLGASNKTYAEAFENEQLAAWIAAHCHAYTFFEGVARITVPDNLKTGVVRPCRYEPLLHRSYQEMAEHYGTAIIPARIKKPRDKAKVEVGVQIAERQILAALRDQRFFSVGELNTAIRPLLTKLNGQPFQKLEGSRNSWFERLEKSQLLPLPVTTFELANWSKAKVNIDYHVAVEKHFYSAPYQLIHQPLDVRLTDKTVELFQHGKRVAAHLRSRLPGRSTTLEEHRPKSHQKHLEWTPSRILEWVKTIGPECVQVVEKIMAERPHPEQGFRSALGIIRLGKAVGHERLEAACRRALHFGTCSYRSLQSILQNNLEAQPLEQELPLPSPTHENLRGSPYYR
jgi:transposase